MRLLAPHRRLLLTLILLLTGCTLNNVSAPSESVSGAPTVRILSPQPNAIYFEGITVIIQATVSNAGSDVNRVEVVVDGTTVTALNEPNPNGAASFNVSYGWAASGVSGHTINVIAYRADGSSSSGDTGTVQITVKATDTTIQTQPTRSGGGVATQTQGQPQPTTQSSQQIVATSLPATAAPTTVAATATPSRPTATFTQAINVRRGPGTEFDPPIGAFTQGQSAEILAINSAGTWYKVRYGGGEGWVFAALTDAFGDMGTLPRDPGPPVPTQPPPTAIPATQAPPPPASNANLVAGIVELNPGQPTCQQTFNIGLDVANLGTDVTSASGTVSVQDIRTADGSLQQTTTGGFPQLQPQQTFRVDMPFTVSTWYNETHTIILIIDQGNQIAENNEADNRREVQYTLQQGTC